MYKDNDADILPVPSAIWRLVTLDRESILFIVINDIFYYYDDIESPFIKKLPDILVIQECDCKELGYNDLNVDEKKPFVFCCNASNILEHEEYRDIFKGKNINSEASVSTKKG